MAAPICDYFSSWSGLSLQPSRLVVLLNATPERIPRGSRRYVQALLLRLTLGLSNHCGDPACVLRLWG